MPSPVPSVTGVSKRYGLPQPDWAYQPYMGRYGRHFCAYCGERSTTVDPIPNPLYHTPRGAEAKPYLLVDACQDCRTRLEAMSVRTDIGSYPKRRHALLVAIRKHTGHVRGRPGPAILLLRRRLSFLTNF